MLRSALATDRMWIHFIACAKTAEFFLKNHFGAAYTMLPCLFVFKNGSTQML